MGRLAGVLGRLGPKKPMGYADEGREEGVPSGYAWGSLKAKVGLFLSFRLEHAPGALPRPAGAGGLPTPAAITAGPSYFRRLRWKRSKRVLRFRHAFLENTVEEAGLTTEASKIMLANSI